MDTIRLQVTGMSPAVAAVFAAVESIDGVSRVEQVADLMPQLDDPDSSSAGLRADGMARAHAIEVDVRDAGCARRVHGAAERAAASAGAALEVDSSEAWDRPVADR